MHNMRRDRFPSVGRVALLASVLAMAACGLPGAPLAKGKATVLLALPEGPPAMQAVSELVAAAVPAANRSGGNDFHVEAVRFAVPTHSGPAGAFGVSRAVQAFAPLLGQETPADLVLITAASPVAGDPLQPASDVREFLDLRFLRSLDEFARADKSFRPADYWPAAHQAVQHQGAAYARPLAVAPFVLVYDLELFTAAGVRPPDQSWTWRSLQDAARRLTSDTDNDGQVDQWGAFAATPGVLAILIWQNGGDIVTRDGRRALIGDPSAMKAIEFLRELALVDRVVPRPTSGFGFGGGASFMVGATQMALGGRSRVAMAYLPVAGRPAIAVTGPAGPGAAAAAGDRPAALRIAEVPQGRTRATGLRVTAALAITSKSQRPDAAYKALAALEREVGKQLLAPARRVTADELRRTQPALSPEDGQTVVRALENARTSGLDDITRANMLSGIVSQRLLVPTLLFDRPVADAVRSTAEALDSLLATPTAGGR